MDFVAEEYGPAAEPAPFFRLLEDLAHAYDTFGHRTEADELPVGVVRDEAGERRLAGTRRPPENDAADVASPDRVAQRLPRTKNAVLPDEFLQRSRPHPRSQRLGRREETERLGHASFFASRSRLSRVFSSGSPSTSVEQPFERPADRWARRHSGAKQVVTGDRQIAPRRRLAPRADLSQSPKSSRRRRRPRQSASVRRSSAAAPTAAIQRRTSRGSAFDGRAGPRSIASAR